MGKFCSNCGKELMEGADVCTNCGKFVNVTTDNNNNMSGNKSKLAAALLAFFLGGLGIHNFYLGYTGKGIAQLLLSVVGWIIIIGPIISGIWAFVEFILIIAGSLNDSDGNKLI